MNVFGQKIEINLGSDEISQNETWTIAITVYNAPLKSYDRFPDIKGFRKGSPASRVYTSSVNGRVTSVQSVIMNYHPLKTGTINVPSISMKVNDQFVKVEGKQVKVNAATQRSPTPNAYNRRPGDFFGDEEPDFVEVRDEAFLSLTTDKKEVYLGEGVNATLAFYIPEDNIATIRWYDLSKQLSEILKKLKPTSCWEENFEIENVEGEIVNINGKSFIRYKIYQAMFYPFNTQPIEFPQVKLDMLKFKVARNPSYFRSNSQETFKTYYSKPVTVKVKDLPPHPLKNMVAVGEFRLDERMMDTNLTTGQSAAYEFNIIGEGNIASLPKPAIKEDGVLEIYEPSSRQELSKNRNRITGTKAFRYFMIPREPGQYKLAPYFKWIFFSPQRQKYDTLHSNLTVYITGESKKNEAIDSQDPGSFYQQISSADNTLRKASDGNGNQWWFHGFLVLMVGTSLVLLFRK
jgi:hypothetical protein